MVFGPVAENEELLFTVKDVNKSLKSTLNILFFCNIQVAKIYFPFFRSKRKSILFKIRHSKRIMMHYVRRHKSFLDDVEGVVLEVLTEQEHELIPALEPHAVGRLLNPKDIYCMQCCGTEFF